MSSESFSPVVNPTQPSYRNHSSGRGGVSPYRGGARNRHRRSKPVRGGTPPWVRRAAIGGGAAGGLILFGLIGLALWRSGGDLFSRHTWIRPTLSSTVAELKTIGEQWRAVIEGIEDEGDVEQAEQRVQELNRELQEVAFRSGRIAAISEEQIEEFSEAAKQENLAVAEKQEPNVVKLLQTAELWSSELSAAQREFQFTALPLAQHLTYGIRRLREPEDDVERLERDHIELLRHYVQVLAEINSGADLAAAAPEIRKLTDQMYELAHQREGMTEGIPEIARDYQQTANALDRQREFQERWLEEEYQPDLEFSVAVADFAEGKHAFSRASWNLAIADRDVEKLRQRQREEIAARQAKPPVERVAREDTPPAESTDRQPRVPKTVPGNAARPDASDRDRDAGPQPRRLADKDSVSGDLDSNGDAGRSEAASENSAAGTDRSPGLSGRSPFRPNRFADRASPDRGDAAGRSDASRTDRLARPYRFRFGGSGSPARSGPVESGGGASDDSTGGRVSIEIVGGGGLDGPAIIDRLRTTLDATRVTYSSAGGKVRIVISYGGDLQRVADAIDFGDVTHVDDVAREIHVTPRAGR